MPALAEPARQADPVGTVISVLQGTEVLRDGKAIPLQDKDPIFVKDTIRTDAQGKAQILFNDDTTVTIGCNASFTIREYTDNGAASSFRGDLGTGMLRIITGRLVERNPLGFHIFTPEANVGIRGTTLTICRTVSSTVVYVESTKKQVYTNDVMVPQGYKVDVSRGMASIPQPMSVADRERIAHGHSAVAGLQNAPAQTDCKTSDQQHAEKPQSGAGHKQDFEPSCPCFPKSGPEATTKGKLVLTGETS